MSVGRPARGHLLRGEGAADGAAARQRREGAVVVAAAVAQPVAAPVERQQRHQQQVRHQPAPSGGHGAEALRAQRVAGLPAMEGQRLARGGVRGRHTVAAASSAAAAGACRSRPPAARSRQRRRRAESAGREHVAASACPAPGRSQRDSPGQRARRRLRSSREGMCGAAMAVGVVILPSLLAQVGTRYRDQDHDSASSRGECLSARGMNDLTHRAAPPHLSRAARCSAAMSSALRASMRCVRRCGRRRQRLPVVAGLAAARHTRRGAQARQLDGGVVQLVRHQQRGQHQQAALAARVRPAP